MLLREVIDEGASRGWQLVSATKEPGADVVLVTWDNFHAPRRTIFGYRRKGSERGIMGLGKAIYARRISR